MSEAREKLGLRMHKVCDRIGLPKDKRMTAFGKKYDRSPTTGRNWLTGEKVPDYETLLQMCLDAKVNIEWLYRGVGPMESSDDQECVVINDPDLIEIFRMINPLTPAGKRLVAKQVGEVIRLAVALQSEFTDTK